MKTRIDGILVVDKPADMTSMEVVRTFKRRFGVKKAGHLGTLDPFATGVLPIAFDEATKLVPFLQEEPKEYEATLRLGEETSTDDLTGEVLVRKPWEHVTREMIVNAFGLFVGPIEQTPPMFSAVKVQGNRLYRLARKGLEIERRKRTVEIFDLKIESICLPLVNFKVCCSKGTYIRTLARDIGRSIGCGGHLIRLRRQRNGPFTLTRSISWNTLNACCTLEDLRPWMVSMREALGHLPEVIGNDHLLKKIRLGQEMRVGDMPSQTLLLFANGEWIKVMSPEDQLVAILRSEIRGRDIRQLHPNMVASRPFRVFGSRAGEKEKIAVC